MSGRTGLDTTRWCRGRSGLEPITNGLLRDNVVNGVTRTQVEADRLSSDDSTPLNAGAEKHGVGVVLVLGAMGAYDHVAPGEVNRACPPAPASLVTRLNRRSMS